MNRSQAFGINRLWSIGKGTNRGREMSRATYSQMSGFSFGKGRGLMFSGSISARGEKGPVCDGLKIAETTGVTEPPLLDSNQLAGA